MWKKLTINSEGEKVQAWNKKEMQAHSTLHLPQGVCEGGLCVFTCMSCARMQWAPCLFAYGVLCMQCMRTWKGCVQVCVCSTCVYWSVNPCTAALFWCSWNVLVKVYSKQCCSVTKWKYFQFHDSREVDFNIFTFL